MVKVFLNTCPISDCFDLNIMFFISVAFPTEAISIMKQKSSAHSDKTLASLKSLVAFPLRSEQSELWQIV